MRKKWSNDPYTKQAKKENYLARSVYKLQEADQKLRFLKNVQSILDLGAAPGSWTQYCLQRCPKAQVVAIDKKPIRLTSNNRLQVLPWDIHSQEFKKFLLEKNFDLVLSDMAPDTTGDRDGDAWRSFELAQSAFEISKQCLPEGGNFFIKLFMGSQFDEFLELIRPSFKKISKLRPKSTRKQSREIFIFGSEFIPTKKA